jgi:hypothetical protein
MASLERIFTVVDDIPSITPVGINIPCFTKLYAEDKSPDKHMYGKWLGYIYHMTALRSPFYDSKNKSTVVAESFMDDADYKPSPAVLACIKECNEREVTAEARSLEAAIVLSDSICDAAMSIKQESERFHKLLKEIDAEMGKTLDIQMKILLMKEKQSLEEKALKKAETASKLVSSMQKSVDEMVKLRKTVLLSQAELEQENKDAISNFMVDNLINRYS